jgi:hypothetical protein
MRGRIAIAHQVAAESKGKVEHFDGKGLRDALSQPERVEAHACHPPILQPIATAQEHSSRGENQPIALLNDSF